MSFLVWDPFQGATVGSGTPTGWSGPSFGSGTVEAFSSGGAFSPHNWFSFSGSGLLTPTFGPETGLTIWFAWLAQGAATQGVILNANCSPASGVDIPAVVMGFADDSSISVYVGPFPGSFGNPTNLIANTGALGLSDNLAYFSAGVWYFFQLNLTISLTDVGGTDFLTATCDLFCDGETLFTGLNKVSNTLVAGDFLGGSPEVHQIAFDQANSGGDSGLGEPYINTNIGAGMLGAPGNLWDFTQVDGGTGYNPATTTVTVGAGDADLAAEITAGVVTGIVPQGTTQLGDSYASPPTITITDSSMSGSGADFTANLTPTPFRRVPQAVVEPAELPTTANIRIPQMVIEVATLAGTPPPPTPTQVSGPTGGGARFVFAPTFCMVKPPGKVRYKGCGRKPDCLHNTVIEREWVEMPPGALTINRQGAIPLPTPASGDNVIFSFLVPIGYDGVLLGQYNTVAPVTAFSEFVLTQGSGDIVWRISAAGRYLRDRGEITVTMGSSKKLAGIAGGLFLRSGNLVEFICNAPNTGGSLPPPGQAFVLAGLHGWFWPRL